MAILIIIYFLLAGFLGYVIGRWGDNYLNVWMGDLSWTPDHWMYGFILMSVGLFVLKSYLALYVFSFGMGLLISDLKDFLNLKFYGSDNKDASQRKFWDID